MVFAYGETSPMVEAVEAGVSRGGSFGKYGAVNSGHLKLQGFLTHATWTIRKYPGKGLM
jgi:hypothetical protein